MAEDVLRALREAVRLSPRNVDLRLHLASTLLAWGKAQEAENEYRAALEQAADDSRAKLGLARAFLVQEKDGEATVLVESLLAQPDTAAEAYLLHARLLLRAGEADRAARAYRTARDLDPDLRDDAFEEPARALARAENPPAAEQLERPGICFADVGGMEALKEQIRLKIIHPMQHQGLYAAYGKKAGGGMLLFGPPGCGKTMIARATAGEAKAAFMSVGIEDVVNKWFGESEQRLHGLCDTARANAPCVLFFFRRARRPRDVATPRPRGHDAPPDQHAALGDGRREVRQRGGALPGRDEHAVGRRSCTAAPGPLRPCPLRAPAGRAGARRNPQGDACRQAPGDHRLPRDRKKPIANEWFATARNYALYANEGGMYDDVLRHLGIS